MNEAQYDNFGAESSDAYPEYIPSSLQADLAGVPAWAIWLFVTCSLLIVAVLLLDYCVIRRNALGNTCCARARQKRNTQQSAHQKRSTNMLLNKLNRNANATIDQDV
ncbi:unnamed protein product [Caenorhabditis auriculariae]|uniref:Uncharacterized protein n=1 Tax=Caenorhabditis auriculariae TaxID=2777116 RepID=A0A8S1GS97_9PELO|nr:unnamed protein product [Caenorhabditis auriculariae]